MTDIGLQAHPITYIFQYNHDNPGPTHVTMIIPYNAGIIL